MNAFSGIDFVPSRVIAVGDIHGCASALEALIGAIDPQCDDLLVFLGDYVDRGPDSCGVIDLLCRLQDRTNIVSLMGNHEIMLLESLQTQANIPFWLQCGGQQTVDSYGGSLDEIPSEHVDFISHCRPYFETETHIFLHANYDPDLPMKQQPIHLLFWEHTMLSPPRPHRSGKIVVVGHTPQIDGEVLNLGHLICLDTHCFGEGWLTAMEVQTGEIWQADKHGKMRVTV